MRYLPRDLSDKTVGETRVITLDLSAWIGTATVDAATWTASPSDLGIADEAVTDSTVAATVSGGAVDTIYTVTASVTLSDGAVLEPFVRLRVIDQTEVA